MYYKYMNFRESFFSNRLIRFTQPQYFNDPFEGTINKRELINELHFQNTNGNLNHLIEFYKVNEVSYGDIGILSLSKTSNNLLMWAHYANEHKGIVIEINNKHYDFKKLIKSVGKIKPVKYITQRPNFSEFLKNKEFPPTPLLFKSKEWKYEQEIRIFVKKQNVSSIAYKTKRKVVLKKPKKSTSIEEELWFVEFSKSVITKVIVGYKADRFEVLLTYVKYVLLGKLNKDTKLSFMTLCTHEFKLIELDFSEIKKADEFFIFQELSFLRLNLEFDLDISKIMDPFSVDVDGDDEKTIDKMFNHENTTLDELLAKKLNPCYLSKINELGI